MDYRNHITEKSLLNTPPVFAVYTCMLTLRWLKAMGGLDAIETLNNQKKRLCYTVRLTTTHFSGPRWRWPTEQDECVLCHQRSGA